MILTVDIGNTTIALALFRCTTKEPIFVEHIESNCSIAVLPYSEWIAKTLKKHNVNPTHIQGAVLSSVVPPLTQTLCDAIIKVIGISTYVINARTDAGLTIKNYDVSTLGSDRIVDAVSAMLQWAPPLVVLDLGTATTVSVIDSDGGFIGGLIIYWSPCQDHFQVIYREQNCPNNPCHCLATRGLNQPVPAHQGRRSVPENSRSTLTLACDSSAPDGGERRYTAAHRRGSPAAAHAEFRTRSDRFLPF